MLTLYSVLRRPCMNIILQTYLNIKKKSTIRKNVIWKNVEFSSSSACCLYVNRKLNIINFIVTFDNRL